MKTNPFLIALSGSVLVACILLFFLFFEWWYGAIVVLSSALFIYFLMQVVLENRRLSITETDKILHHLENRNQLNHEHIHEALTELRMEICELRKEEAQQSERMGSLYTEYQKDLGKLIVSLFKDHRAALRDSDRLQLEVLNSLNQHIMKMEDTYSRSLGVNEDIRNVCYGVLDSNKSSYNLIKEKSEKGEVLLQNIMEKQSLMLDTLLMRMKDVKDLLELTNDNLSDMDSNLVNLSSTLVEQYSGLVEKITKSLEAAMLAGEEFKNNINRNMDLSISDFFKRMDDSLEYFYSILDQKEKFNKQDKELLQNFAVLLGEINTRIQDLKKINRKGFDNIDEIKVKMGSLSEDIIKANNEHIRKFKDLLEDSFDNNKEVVTDISQKFENTHDELLTKWNDSLDILLAIADKNGKITEEEKQILEKLEEVCTRGK